MLAISWHTWKRPAVGEKWKITGKSIILIPISYLTSDPQWNKAAVTILSENYDLDNKEEAYLYLKAE